METSSEPKGSFKQARISSDSMWRTRRYTVTGAEEKTAGKAVFIGELIKREDIEENFKKEARGRKMKYMARKAP